MTTGGMRCTIDGCDQPQVMDKRCRPHFEEHVATKLLKKRCAPRGLTVSDFHGRHATQGGVCAICQQEAPILFIDHEHGGGQVRGLLCRKCNTGLGYFNDSPDALIRAAAYLKETA